MLGNYPTDIELAQIETWPVERGYYDLMDYVKTLWEYADVGYFEIKKPYYSLHTGGWSGNEDLIRALKDNTIFWSMCWQVTVRGGNYDFVIPEEVQSCQSTQSHTCIPRPTKRKYLRQKTKKKRSSTPKK